MARSLLLRRRSRGNDSLKLRNHGIIFSVHTRARLGPAQPEQHRTPHRAPNRALKRAPAHRRNSLRCLRLRCNCRRCWLCREGCRRQRARHGQVRNRRLAPPAANPFGIRRPHRKGGRQDIGIGMIKAESKEFSFFWSRGCCRGSLWVGAEGSPDGFAQPLPGLLVVPRLEVAASQGAARASAEG